MYNNLSNRLRGEAQVSDASLYIKDLMREAAEAIENLISALTASNEVIAKSKKSLWIPVTERLPEDGERALVMRFDYVTNMPFYDLLWFDKGEWWNRRYTGNYAVTHWQPLPTPPKEET